MNIQIDTKAKTVQFLNEFTFKDLKDLKNYINDIEDWKIIPYSIVNSYPWSQPINLMGSNPTTTKIAKTYTDGSLKYNMLTEDFKNAMDNIEKGLNREKITEFVNT